MQSLEALQSEPQITDPATVTVFECSFVLCMSLPVAPDVEETRRSENE